MNRNTQWAVGLLAVALAASVISAQRAEASMLNAIPGQLLICDENTFNVVDGEIIDKRQSFLIDQGDRFVVISGGSGAVMDSGILVPNKWDKDLSTPPTGVPDPEGKNRQPNITKHGGDLVGMYSYTQFPIIWVEWDCRK